MAICTFSVTHRLERRPCWAKLPDTETHSRALFHEWATFKNGVFGIVEDEAGNIWVIESWKIRFVPSEEFKEGVWE